ncbi:hypothetical protein ACRALDRAFT_1083053 [Sodiomyces alcalophilus JCM 7366]|uniref:uncharacterized protein n=1 Tax=Sodiomyces alcalophilus JCM 7366 TaxID=591952 RepID=UPI0039B66504
MAEKDTDESTNSQPRPQDQQPRQRRPRRGLLPPELIEVVVPSLKVGAFTGATGVFFGVTAGIIRDASPALFGIASGFQCFTLGSTYWLSRSLTLRTWGSEELTNSDKTKASTLAGATAGMVGGLIRGPRNIIPGAIVWSIVCGSGQAAVNAFQATDPSSPDQETQGKKGILSSRWSPLKKLTDDEYRHVMSEKMLRLDAEIALVDEKIAELRVRAADEEQGRNPEA